ncbi:beta-propeller fold lactonase family protein [Nocardia sp. NPDC051832]|uniref:beta-propeller fold lactonase family protein n=1 Tax=Nocardia sp. NPDC051832 TaxID=3155673 RepID=UPI00341D4F0E
MRTRTTLSACLALMMLTACGSGGDEAAVTIERIVTVSDGDYLASTYVDGVLAPDGQRDLLTRLRIDNGEVSAEHLEVSNSVTSAPEVLALSPDGTTAFVTERLGQRQPGMTRAQQLPQGNRLFAVDISSSPRIIGTTTIAHSPEALAVSPDGARIATASNTAEASIIQLIPWTTTGFGESRQYDLATLGITGDPARPRGGALATNVHWHPNGRAVAVNITTQNRVAFFTVDDTGLRPWGAPVTTGADPFVGRFTPDGRHYVTSDWGRNLTTTNLAERLPATRSKLSVIRLTATGDHHVTATAESDKSAEGIAINPAGDRIATINMRGTVFPPDSPAHDPQASVSLLRLDPTTGALTKLGDYPLDGILPEGGAFDPTGNYFLATIYQPRTPTSPGSGLQIYRVTPDRLTPIQHIPLPHGVHHVATTAK